MLVQKADVVEWLVNLCDLIIHHVTLTHFGGVKKRGNSIQMLLIDDRADVSERRMQSLSIVKHLQILKDRLPSLSTRLLGLSLHALGLQGSDEALHQRVVVAIPLAAHTDHIPY